MSGRMVLSVVLQACGMVTATTGLVLFLPTWALVAVAGVVMVLIGIWLERDAS